MSHDSFQIEEQLSKLVDTSLIPISEIKNRTELNYLLNYTFFETIADTLNPNRKKTASDTVKENHYQSKQFPPLRSQLSINLL